MDCLHTQNIRKWINGIFYIYFFQHCKVNFPQNYSLQKHTKDVYYLHSSPKILYSSSFRPLLCKTRVLSRVLCCFCMINIKNSISCIPIELCWADQSDKEYRTFCKRKPSPVTNMGCLTQQHFPGFQQLPAQGILCLLSVHTGIHINCSVNLCKLKAFTESYTNGFTDHLQRAKAPSPLLGHKSATNFILQPLVILKRTANTCLLQIFCTLFKISNVSFSCSFSRPQRSLSQPSVVQLLLSLR